MSRKFETGIRQKAGRISVITTSFVEMAWLRKVDRTIKLVLTWKDTMPIRLVSA